jgi:hypothetical protein
MHVVARSGDRATTLTAGLPERTRGLRSDSVRGRETRAQRVQYKMSYQSSPEA